jgi:hypothetical protein
MATSRSPVAATTPVFTVLVAHALTDDEKLTPLRVLGVGLGFVGVVVLVWPDRMPGVPDRKSASRNRAPDGGGDIRVRRCIWQAVQRDAGTHCCNRTARGGESAHAAVGPDH